MPTRTVSVRSTDHPFQQRVEAGPHVFDADEPISDRTRATSAASARVLTTRMRW